MRRVFSDTWDELTDEQLLDLRFCDLSDELRGLRIEGTPLERRLALLEESLERRGLFFHIHTWLAEEWFSSDDAPGIAIPFYLSHPRLAKLEASQMFDVEGGSERECLRLLRHEAGHAIECAFKLHRRKRWREVFGDHREPYPENYAPQPESRDHVLHLEGWYAQSHPCEDFAETFAVWLGQRSRWRKQYADWPALEKLEYVDELMASLVGRAPLVPAGPELEPISEVHRTLREHYAEKRAHYEIDVPRSYDADLRRLFSDVEERAGGRLSAAAYLRRASSELCRCSSGVAGESRYALAQIVEKLRIRCRALDLRITRPLQEVERDVVEFLRVESAGSLRDAHHRIPV